MRRYYIMTVDSFQDTFSKIESINTFYYKFQIQDDPEILNTLESGDVILVYRKAPLSCINICIEVLDVDNDRVKVKKKIEVDKKIKPCDSEKLENNYLQEIDVTQYNNIIKQMIEDYENNDYEDNKLSEERVTGATNELYYGVPGAGKSHAIKEKCDDENLMQRVVFHPDYTYSDFVGQIMPRLKKNDQSGEEKLQYTFVEGPFTKALKEAEKDPGNMHYLVIEEINRGNAPAIFGEIFQLLDRDNEGKSEYSIVNYDIAECVYGNSEHRIEIPSNLTLLATMNTSDQNVFTLDTAFQRRWNMKLIPNDVEKAKHANTIIEGTNVTWGDFALTINDEIIHVNQEMASSEDKRLGAYFVGVDDLTEEKFPEKAIKYLWDDAFKMNHEQIFGEKMDSLEKVIRIYHETKEADKLAAIFQAGVYARMLHHDKKNENEDEE